jgi:hypothetical protein
MGCEHVTSGWLSSVEDSVEAAGVSWLDGPGFIVTCGSLSSVEDGVEAAGVSWLDGPGFIVTCNLELCYFLC